MMLTPEDVIKLMDFGIAKSKSDKKLTQTGTTMGSLFYMSAEQVQGNELDGRSDLYSVGVSLYEMVTGIAAIPGQERFRHHGGATATGAAAAHPDDAGLAQSA